MRMSFFSLPDEMVSAMNEFEKTWSRLDGELSATMPKEIGALAAEILREPVRIEGAQISANWFSTLGVTPVLDDRLREQSFGVAGGRDRSWLDARLVPPPADGDRLNHAMGIDGSETRRDVACRVYRAMTDALALDVDSLIVVTHGIAATFVVAAWIGMPVAAAGHVAFRVSPGSITTLREDEFWHHRAVVSLGDRSHLSPEPSSGGPRW
jgi:broad specificity phosphatase PhoE